MNKMWIYVLIKYQDILKQTGPHIHIPTNKCIRIVNIEINQILMLLSFRCDAAVK